MNQDIKTKEFSHLYFLYGDEAYLRLNYKKALTRAIIGDDTMNYNYYEGAQIDVNELISQAETMPFFAPRRLIVVENSDFAKNSNDAITDYISNIPDYLYLIFVESQVDARTRFFKACKSKGVTVCFESFQGEKLRNWVGVTLKKNDKKMTNRDLDYFLSLTGEDMSNITNELEKLICYTGERQIIESDDIDALVTRQIGDNIFKMIEQMGNRNQPKAMEYYYDLLAKREAPFKILSLIARQFNILLQVKELVALRCSDNQIASKLGLYPRYVKDYIGQSKKFDASSLRRALEACVEADESIKTGRMSDKLAVELIIVEFSK